MTIPDSEKMQQMRAETILVIQNVLKNRKNLRGDNINFALSALVERERERERERETYRDSTLCPCPPVSDCLVAVYYLAQKFINFLRMS